MIAAIARALLFWPGLFLGGDINCGGGRRVGDLIEIGA